MSHNVYYVNYSFELRCSLRLGTKNAAMSVEKDVRVPSNQMASGY